MSWSDVLAVHNSSLQKITPKSPMRASQLMPHNVPRFGISGSHKKTFSLVQLPLRLPTDFHTYIHWCSSDLAERDGNAVLNTIKTDIADQSFSSSILPIVRQQPDFF